MLGWKLATSHQRSAKASETIAEQTCCQMMINALVEHGLTKAKIAAAIDISTRTITKVSSGRIPALKPLPFKKLLMLYCGCLEKPLPMVY